MPSKIGILISVVMVQIFNRISLQEKGFKIGPSGILGPVPRLVGQGRRTKNPRRPYFENIFQCKELVEFFPPSFFVHLLLLFSSTLL